MVSPITADIAATISAAPAWALISLTMPDEQLRAAGAEGLARWIKFALDGGEVPDPGQMVLPL